jgi:hypothetical protein
MIRVWFNKTFSSLHAALTLIREADRDGRFRLVCSHPTPYAVAPLAAHEAASEPDGLTGEDYVDWCLAFCREQAIDVFVPGKEASHIAQRQADFLAQGVKVFSAAPAGMLECLHDKARFYASARAPTAPAPACESFDSLAAFDDAYRRLRARHPALCMKPSVSVYGIGFRRIVEEASALDLLFDGNAQRIDLASLRAAFTGAAQFRVMLLMPYLAGHEFSVDCVACQGKLLCAVARRKPRDGRDGHGQLIVARPDIEEACVDLSAQFQLDGNVNIQFREDEDGRLHILEINPRLSGGVAMACLAGPNLPWIALASFVYGPASVSIPPIRAGLRVGEINKALELAQ